MHNQELTPRNSLRKNSWRWILKAHGFPASFLKRCAVRLESRALSRPQPLISTFVRKLESSECFVRRSIVGNIKLVK
jgi:hypothetical protein